MVDVKEMLKIMENVNTKESEGKVVKWTKKSLSLLEKETRINFFKSASDWLKNIFWLNNSSEKKSHNESAINQAKNNNSENPGNNLDAYTNEHINKSVVKKARNYISGWWTFYSDSKWTITWGRDKYKHVCSTWSYNVLWRLWLPKVSESTECDLKWTILPKMGLEYIWEVNPNNPGKNWYKPQDGDTAVWPRFKNGNKMTQHQATFINWYWVSDTIQSQMSCYSSKNEPMVKIYRYNWKAS